MAEAELITCNRMLKYDESFKFLVEQGLIHPTFGTRHLYELEENVFSDESIIRFGFVNDEVVVKIVLVLEKLIFNDFLKEDRDRNRVRRKWAEHPELVNCEYFPYALVKYNPKYAVAPLDRYDGDQGSVDIPYKENFRRVLSIRDLNDCFILSPGQSITDKDLPLARWTHDAPKFQVSRRLYALADVLAVKPDMLKDFLTTEVDGRETFYYLKYLLLKFADIEEWVASMIALWIMATHVHTLFSAFPYAHMLATMGSGKSRILKIAALTSHVGMYVADPTAATVVRGIELASCTLCIDEAEKLSGKDAKEINAALNAGYERGPTIPRCNQDNYNQIDFFSPYSPKMFASTVGPPPALQSRCLRIPVKRSTNPKYAKMEPYDDMDTFERVHKDLFIWSIDQAHAIASIEQSKILQKYEERFRAQVDDDIEQDADGQKKKTGVPIRLLQLMVPLLAVYEHLRLDEAVPVNTQNGIEYQDERKNLDEMFKFQFGEHKYTSVEEDDARILVAAYKLARDPLEAKKETPTPITPGEIIKQMALDSPDRELSKEEKKKFNTKKIGRVMSKYLVPKRYVDGVVQYCPGMTYEQRKAALKDVLDRYSIDVRKVEGDASQAEGSIDEDTDLDSPRWEVEEEG